MNIKENSLRNLIIVLLVLYQFPVLAQHVVDGGFYAGINGCAAHRRSGICGIFTFR